MADKIINVRIQQRYDTEANWKAKDPVLLKGEIVYTSDGTNIGKYKVGNGTSKWSALPYAKADLSKGDVTTALGYTPPTSNTWRGIQNNLTSDSTTDSLSAAQGKVLKGLVDGKAASSHNHDSVYSKLGHTHSYLPLSGGDMTGSISSSLVTNTHLAGNKGTAIINSTASGTGYTMLAKMNSKNGVWTFGNYLTEFMLYYTANTTVSAGTNAPTYGVRLLDESGNSKFPGTVTANSFSGPLSGNASTSTVATKLGRGGDTSAPMVFNWSGKDGQPSWLWGGSDGTNMYVYNPSNFSVKYATSAGSATNATYLNIVATNEIRFNKPSRTKKESLWFGYAWSDGSKSDLISTYCFGNGNGGYAHITASQFNGPLNGNASTASSAAKWTTARTFTLTGSVTGSVSIDGSGNVSLATTTNHTHDLSTMINNLSTGSSDPVDTDYYIAQWAGGGSSTTSYHRRPHSALWNYIKSKANSVYQPKGSYAASSHTHDDRYYTESEINTKLASKSDTSHTHNYVVGSYTGNGGQQKPNYFGTNKVGFLMMNTTVNGDSNYKDWIIMDCYGGNDVGGSVALGVNRQKLAAYIMRSAAERSSWAESAELLHTLNYTSYTVTKTGSGASGTWGINITGSAGSVAWGNVSGRPSSLPASDVPAWAKASTKPSYSWSEIGSKPSTFTPSSHNHSYLTLYGGRPANINFSTSTNGTGAMFHFVATSSTKTGKPPEDSNILQMNWDNNGGWDTQFAISPSNKPSAYIRSQNSGSWGEWLTLLDSSNYTSYTVTKTGSGASGTWGINVTGSAGSVAWGNVSGRPSSMPASDVYSWAKASSKPSYSWSEISGRPSSLPASDVYAWAKASTKPSYSWNEIGSKPTTFTPATHTHSYLPLSGGTMTGQIKRDSCGGSWISARTNAPLVGSGSTSGGWNPIVAQKTKNGSWSIGNLNGNEHLSFSYTTDADYNNGKNVATTINLPPTSGTLCLTNHTHPYLPTTGGTLNNGSTQCPLIITGAANNESSITFKYKTQTSGGHWVVGQGAGTANIDTFAFYKNGAGTLATLMADGQFRFNKLTLSGYQQKEYTAVGGVGAIANDYTIRFRGGTDGYFITKGPSSLNFGWDTDTSVVGDGSGSWGYTFRMQMKYCYCDVGFRSSGIYHSTISGSSNLNISSDGTIKRVSSAAKYKLDIQNINKPDTYAYNLLNLNPKQWFDKGETERYAKYLTAQYSGEKLRDEEESELLDGSINPYYGLIAEDVKAAGLDEFCIYGKADKNGKKELEGIQYDRLPILTIPILRDLVTCMQKILPSVEKNISDPTLLSEVKEIESRFNSFNPQNIVNKQYAN